MTKFWIQGKVLVSLSKSIEAKNIDEAWSAVEKKGIGFFEVETDYVDCDEETFEVNSITLYKCDKEKK